MTAIPIAVDDAATSVYDQIMRYPKWLLRATEMTIVGAALGIIGALVALAASMSAAGYVFLFVLGVSLVGFGHCVGAAEHYESGRRA